VFILRPGGGANVACCCRGGSGRGLAGDCFGYRFSTSSAISTCLICFENRFFAGLALFLCGFGANMSDSGWIRGQRSHIKTTKHAAFYTYSTRSKGIAFSSSARRLAAKLSRCLEDVGNIANVVSTVCFEAQEKTYRLPGANMSAMCSLSQSRSFRTE
jgi:hypothetical protein